MYEQIFCGILHPISTASHIRKNPFFYYIYVFLSPLGLALAIHCYDEVMGRVDIVIVIEFKFLILSIAVIFIIEHAEVLPVYHISIGQKDREIRILCDLFFPYGTIFSDMFDLEFKSFLISEIYIVLYKELAIISSPRLLTKSPLLASWTSSSGL